MITQGAFPIPHTNGLRPRTFLAARRAMMKKDIIIKGANAKDYQRIHNENSASKEA